MQVKTVGFQPINFTNANGEQIQGTNLFVAFKDDNVQGLRTEKFFVKSEIALPEQTKVNDILEISFNHKGKIESITKA